MELTKQQKLEILCAYLPHGVEAKSPSGNIFILGTYSNMRGSGKEQRSIETAITYDYSPILRHPDDMTEEEKEVYDQLFLNCIFRYSEKNIYQALRYLHSLHIDTFGAIEAGWAIRKETN